MCNYDIVYIKGNPSSGTPLLHEQMNSTILKIIKDYHYIIIDSEDKNLSGKVIPVAKVYIGFSRGSRYLKKLPTNILKISIGGIKGSKINLFKNDEDCVVAGDLSLESLKAHFEILEKDKIKIKNLITNFLK